MENESRIAGHLLATHQQVRRAFPDAPRLSLQQAISASEAHHAGEICLAVEPSLELGPVLRSRSARERAIELLSERQLWDTEHRNGVLICLLMADREVKIAAVTALLTQHFPLRRERRNELSDAPMLL